MNHCKLNDHKDNNDQIQKFKNFISNERRNIPFITIQKPICQDKGYYPLIQFIGMAALNKYDIQNVIDNKLCTIQTITNATIIGNKFKLQNDGRGKSNLMQKLYACVYNEYWNDIKLRKIDMNNIFIDNLSKTEMQLFNIDFNDITLSFCAHQSNRNNSNRKEGITKTIGTKLNIWLMVNHTKYDKLTNNNKLLIYRFIYVFKNYLQSAYGINNFGNLVRGYYYRPQMEHEYSQQLTMPVMKPYINKKFKLTINAMKPFINYSPEDKPIVNIQQFYQRQNKKIISNKLYICHRIYKNVIHWSVQFKLINEHIQFVSNKKYFKKYCQSNAQETRIKSFNHYGYRWNNQQQLNTERKHQQFGMADKVAEGIRYIDEFVPNHFKFITKLLQQYDIIDKEDDLDRMQYAANYYTFNNKDKDTDTDKNNNDDEKTNDKVSVSIGLDNHTECHKFDKVYSISIGMNSILSYDGQMGCNCVVGIPLWSGSVIDFDMKNYFMGGSNILGKSKGGKHGILKMDQIFYLGDCRIVFLLRIIKPNLIKQAQKHFNKCHNNDFKCHC